MSVSPTEDTLIVALDFEGEIIYIPLLRVRNNLGFHAQQASTVSSVQPRRTCFSCFLTPLYQISCVDCYSVIIAF